MSYHDMVIDILSRTQDGNLLTPRDLKLTELACNTMLSEAGDVALCALHSQVVDGSYFTTPHWFRGIEHMTRDHEGYVYWKGKSIEHYSFDDADRELAAAQELAARCLKLEANGIPVSGRAVLSSACYDASPDTPWKLALQTYYAFFEKGESFVGIFYRRPTTPGNEFISFSIEVKDGSVLTVPYEDSYTAFHALQNDGYTCMDCNPSFAEVTSRFERLGISPERLDVAISGATQH